MCWQTSSASENTGVTHTTIVLLQLRTYAVAGRTKFLAYFFIAADILAVIFLIVLGVQIEMAIRDRKANTSFMYMYFSMGTDGNAYDPVLWMALAPLDFLTLFTNFWLIGKAYWGRKRKGGQVARLMWVILRDNIFYLTL